MHTFNVFGFLFLLSIFSFSSLRASLVVELHPDVENNLIVRIIGSGTTGDDDISQLTNGITFGEQWLNLSGNPFDDVLNPDNLALTFDTPLRIQQEGATEVFITGIEVDNDNTGDDEDDFRIFVNQDMLANTAYSINGTARVTPGLSFDNFHPGSYTDDTDGGTTFLNGFTLVVDPTVIPEPSVVLLTFFSLGLMQVLRRRHTSSMRG